MYDQPPDVAKKIMQVTTDHHPRMRYPVGHANMILILRKLLSIAWFHRIASHSNEG